MTVTPAREVAALHRAVDTMTARLVELHADRLQCGRGCSSCCADGLTVFEVEAEVIRSHHRVLLATGAPHGPGACAFLDEAGACRIYDERPYVCRTQGLPLRWLDEVDGAVVEGRDVCPLNEVETEPVEALRPDACWTIGPVEDRLVAIQLRRGPPGKRVALRSLFASGGGALAVEGRDGAESPTEE